MGFGWIGLRRGGNGGEVGEVFEMYLVEEGGTKKKRNDFDFYPVWFDNDEDAFCLIWRLF